MRLLAVAAGISLGKTYAFDFGPNDDNGAWHIQNTTTGEFAVFYSDDAQKGTPRYVPGLKGLTRDQKQEALLALLAFYGVPIARDEPLHGEVRATLTPCPSCSRTLPEDFGHDFVACARAGDLATDQAGAAFARDFLFADEELAYAERLGPAYQPGKMFSWRTRAILAERALAAIGTAPAAVTSDPLVALEACRGNGGQVFLESTRPDWWQAGVIHRTGEGPVSTSRRGTTPQEATAQLYVACVGTRPETT